MPRPPDTAMRLNIYDCCGLKQKERRTQNRQIPPMPSGTSFKTRRMRNFNNPPTADAYVAIADTAASAAAGECKVNFVA